MSTDNLVEYIKYNGLTATQMERWIQENPLLLQQRQEKQQPKVLPLPLDSPLSQRLLEIERIRRTGGFPRVERQHSLIVRPQGSA